MEFMLTGRHIPADEAARWGMVNKVVPQDALMDEARAMAALINENAPLAVQHTKEAVLKGLRTPDVREGIANAKLISYRLQTSQRHAGGPRGLHGEEKNPNGRAARRPQSYPIQKVLWEIVSEKI